MGLLIPALLCGCQATQISEPLYSSGERAPATTGAVPTLTTPSYYTPATPEKNDIYTPSYQLKLLADRDFEEKVFLVVQEEGMESAIFPTSDDFAAAYADRRNRLVQEKYNVQLTCIKMSREEIFSGLTTAKSRGSYFCDLLIVTPSLLAQLKQKNLLLPLESLPFFQTDSICIRDDATAEINSGWAGTYGIWGDALRQPSQAYAVYYNRAYAEQLNCPNLYSMVQKGTWDFQTFAYFASLGKYSYDGEIADLLFGCAGLHSATDEGKALFADENYLSLVNQLTALQVPVASTAPVDANELPETADAPTEGSGESDSALSAKEAFLSGESLFYIGTLGELSEFAMGDLSTGLLPLPKYDASATDYPYLLNQTELPVFACPVNVTSTEGTGIMLSALNAASCAEVEEFFLQNAETLVRDNGSSLMLPYCISSLFFDRSLIYPQ